LLRLELGKESEEIVPEEVKEALKNE
jgi:hypothetical protein